MGDSTKSHTDLDRRPPRRVNADNGPWPLHDVASTRRAEQAALSQFPRPPLMARAGHAVARLALAMAGRTRRVVVVAGPGNNGGDGLVAAAHLHKTGLRVDIALLGDSAALPDDAAAAFREARSASVPVRFLTNAQVLAPLLQDAELVIDALLGLGASRAPEGPMAAAIAAINACKARGVPVLAVDLPSGLHADTGSVLGAAAVRATATLSLLTLKPGCFTHAGRDHAGAVWLHTLGVDAGAPVAWLAGAPRQHPREQASHKGSFGNVIVVGGASGMAGALWLASRAASAAGAGRVYCSPLDDDMTLLDPQHPELMGRRHAWQASAQWLADATTVCGCGGGDDAIKAALPPLLARAPRLVLDADALNAVAADSSLLALLQQRATRGHHTLLTPHPLEAARLLGCTVPELQADRLAAARSLAQRCNCTVLLKGSGSIVAAPNELPWINSTGNAALATAG
ncbi:MAG: NAD(P)H-hydrate dehydratase, partial [Rubrivivax sp.]